MSGPSFFQTLMGRQFIDGTMPRIARALEQIAERLEQPSGAPKVIVVVTDGGPEGAARVVEALREAGIAAASPGDEVQ